MYVYLLSEINRLTDLIISVFTTIWKAVWYSRTKKRKQQLN